MHDIYPISMIMSIAVFTFSTYITPGPTNIILLSSVLSFGYKKTLPFMIANIISYPIMVIFVGLGVGLFLTQHPTIMSVLKVVGIIYLFWMAWKIAKDSSSYNSDSQIKPLNFWQGFIYPWLNPKAWIVNTSAISIFVTSVEKSFWQISIIVLFVFISMLITVSTWSFGGVMLKRFMKDEKFIKRLNLTMAVLLVASILPIII